MSWTNADRSVAADDAVNIHARSIGSECSDCSEGRGPLMRPIAVVPHKTHPWLNQTNGFTIGKRYPIHTVSVNGLEIIVRNDNGQDRSIGLDEGNNAHLQYQDVRGRVKCAGYFKIEYETSEDSNG